jgi:MFS family permease
LTSDNVELYIGYDVGNTANIQAPIYGAFGDIDLLPWVACAFSMASFAVTPIVRRLTGIFDLRILLASAVIVVCIGAAITGSAQNMATVIVGRVVNGMGSAGTYQL